jgi:AraC-like DNA-binding protein
MQRAKALLEETLFSVKEVMVKVGFNDASHFVRDFRNQYGLTPKKYRSRYRNGSRFSQQTSSPANKKVFWP